MKPYYQDNHVTIYNGDCRSMIELPDDSVQCVVTSPPYWGLRKYAGNQDLIWGDNHHEHEWIKSPPPSVPRAGNKKPSESGCESERKILEKLELHHNPPSGNTCSICGAWRGAYGLEPTPELYVQHTIEILREIRRVLRKDGVVFWNIGDSYGGSGKGGGKTERSAKQLTNVGSYSISDGETNYVGGNVKPKDLCLIPFRVALAAQSDGWWVRSIIIWSKSNPMPESVTDRPTESHEYIIMLTKSGTSQYWTHRDLPGTRQRPKPDYRWENRLTHDEVSQPPENWKVKIPCPDCKGTGIIETDIGWFNQEEKCSTCAGKGETTLWRRFNLWKGHDYYWDQEAVREQLSTPEELRHHFGIMKKGDEISYRGLDEARPESFYPNSGRNLRSVWEFPTQPFKGAHFATFPEELPERCIKAATPEKGCCAECGAPWVRVVERKRLTRPELPKGDERYRPNTYNGAYADINGKADAGYTETKTLGWRPSCDCQTDKPPVPSIVLDPFAGSGTTLWVAKKLNRKAVGYEISEQYCKLATKRNLQQVIL